MARCKVCLEANADYRLRPGDEGFRPGFIPAGPMAPMTGFTCNSCHGTGQAPFWVVYPEAS